MDVNMAVIVNRTNRNVGADLRVRPPGEDSGDTMDTAVAGRRGGGTGGLRVTSGWIQT